jgi:hypothetical protein
VGCLASLCLHVSDIDKATGKKRRGAGAGADPCDRYLGHPVKILLLHMFHHHLMRCCPAALLPR